MSNVKEAFRDYDWQSLDRIDGVLKSIYRSILLCKGDNDYELPHSAVRKRQLNGLDITDHTVDNNLVNL